MENNKKKESHNLIQGKHTTIGDIAKKILESTDFTNTSDELVNEQSKRLLNQIIQKVLFKRSKLKAFLK